MSWRATVWAIEEPRSGKLSNTALRVLLALADHAHDDGSAAWESASKLAKRLGVSERSVERAISTLRSDGLIVHGDQDLVAGQRANRRPVVWDLDMPGRAPARADNPDGPQEKAPGRRADKVDGPRRLGPTGSGVRADSQGGLGPTPGVGQNINEHQEHQRAAPADAHGDLSAVDDPAGDVLAYCRRCGHQHAPGSSCRTATLPAPTGWRLRSVQ